jgi:mono/diheme cytochrome c family protein
MRTLSRIAGVCLAATFAALPVHAQTPGDASRGRVLSETWCSSCHLVSAANGPRANDGAPSFDAIARQPSTTSTGLRVFLQTPHPRMPNDVLSVAQTDDIVAYILSLKR